MNNVINLRNTVSLDVRIARIKENWSKTAVDYIDGIIATGKELIAAQDEHGDTLREMAEKLPFDWTTANRLMAIAKSAVAHAQQRIYLPPSWMALYELTKVPEDIMLTAIKDGRINPGMTRKDAVALIPPTVKLPTGKAPEVINAIKRSKGGLTTDEARAELPDMHAQTVNSTINRLAKGGWLVDTGKRRDSGHGGRKAIVYNYNPNPKPVTKKKTGKSDTVTTKALIDAIDSGLIPKALKQWKVGKSDKVIATKALDIVEALLVDVVDSGLIPKALKQWKTGKSDKVIATKALDLVEALMNGRGTNAHLKLRDRWAQELDEQGQTINFGQVFGRESRWPKWVKAKMTQKKREE